MKPNILVFMTDQQRGDSVYPFERAKTPNVTAFCKEGLSFTNAHTVAPHCCPSRATFFSGLYPSQHGVWNNVDVANTLSKGLYEGVRLFSEDLKDNGYRMYYSGKWHVSHYEGPLERGFDYLPHNGFNYTVNYRHDKPDPFEWAQYKDLKPQQERGEGQVLRPGYPTYSHYGVEDNPKGDDTVIDDAIDIIKNRSKIDLENNIKGGEKAPWFQYVGPVGPHDPYFLPQKFLDMYNIDDIELPENFYDTMKDKPALYRKTRDRFDQLSEREQKEAIRHYLAYCSYEDDLFGKVLKALDETGQKENTLVIYMSDHGDYMAEHGLWAKGLPCFEGAYHIPVAMRWPGHIKNIGRTEDNLITIADFAPTFLEIAGIKTNRKMAGYSLVPYINDEKPPFVQDALYTQSNGNEIYGIQRSVKTSDWKYVYNGFDYDELYNLKKDPNETKNIFEENKNSDIVKKMSQKMWNFAKSVDDVCINSYILVALSTYGPGVIYDNNEGDNKNE